MITFIFLCSNGLRIICVQTLTRCNIVRREWNPTGKPVVPLKYPSSASVFALRATPRQDAAVIRLALGVTSRRSN